MAMNVNVNLHMNVELKFNGELEVKVLSTTLLITDTDLLAYCIYCWLIALISDE